MSPGMTPELEIILAEGAGMEPGYSSDKVSSSFACFFCNDYHLTKRIASELHKLLIEINNYVEIISQDMSEH